AERGSSAGGRTASTSPQRRDAGQDQPPGQRLGLQPATGQLLQQHHDRAQDEAQIAFPVQIATMPGDPTSSTAALWLGQGGEGGLVHRLPVNSSISSK